MRQELFGILASLRLLDFPFSDFASERSEGVHANYGPDNNFMQSSVLGTVTKFHAACPEPQVSILRGLKERYEVHHGVRLQDAALVSAAQLSHRYIADRFLPDKAIDLVDEAAAKLNIEASLVGMLPRTVQ